MLYNKNVIFLVLEECRVQQLGLYLSSSFFYIN